MVQKKSLDNNISAQKTPEKLRYASRSMKERRQRILDEMTTLISEKGIDSITLQEVSERAGVSQKTLYNVFGDKEALLASVIKSYRKSYLHQNPIVDHKNIDNILRDINRICSFIIENYQLSKIINNSYFSANAGDDLHSALRDMPAARISGFLEYHRKTGDICPWVHLDTINLQFSNAVHCVTRDWQMGRIRADHYALSIQYALISALIAVASDPMRAELTTRLHNISLGLRNEERAGETGT